MLEVDRLLKELQQNLEKAKLSLQQQEQLLGQVKVYGRDRNTAGSIFTQKGISTLSKYALESKSSTASHEALRCLANAFLMNEPCRQMFVDDGFAPAAAERLKNDDRDDEFLISRILFLLTYNTSLDFPKLFEEHQLADSINRNVAHHAKTLSKSSEHGSKMSPIEDMALADTLKLMFNLTYHYEALTSRFTPAIEPLISILVHHPIPSPPLQSPITYVLNALLNLDLGASGEKAALENEAKPSPLFPSDDPESVLERLTSILYKAIQEHPEKELDQAAAPLCTLLRRVYELGSPQMRIFMRGLLLPTDADRNKPLGQAETLSARLLHLSCSPNIPTLRDNISSLLFELSDKNASTFIQNIGYGYASGFLMSHNIEVPKGAMAADNSANDDSSAVEQDINPITGQRRAAEERDAPVDDDWTEEEKEREAERLFVLFERLKATGVVDVKNPVQQAIDEGRFEEVE